MTAGRAIIAWLAASFIGCAPASAAVLGVVAPRSGPYASLGDQIISGARQAAKVTGDTIVEIDETCEESGGSVVARKLKEADAAAAVGFLCAETLATALPQLKGAGIPAITVSVRSGVLMEDAIRGGWHFYRMAPAEGDEAEKLAEIMLTLWKAEPIALIDDGTIYGRELASAIRERLEPAGITPVFTDTFRPGQEQQISLVRRLAKAGATHVFVGGDRNDASIIARDAASEEIPLTLIGGDALRAANRPVPLRDGVLAVALPDYAGLRPATAAAGAMLKKGIEPEGYVLPAYAAVQVVQQAMNTATGQPLAEALVAGRFSTVIGPVRFDETHELADNPFRLLEWRGTAFAVSQPATE